MRTLLIAVASVMTLGAAPLPETLRLAAISPKDGPCGPLDAASSQGEKAYYEHLGKRLGMKVLKCPVSSPAAAAAALAANRVDVALLDPAAFAPVEATTRSILTLRPTGGVNRIPVVLSVRASDPAKGLADLRGKSVVYGGRSQASLATPQRALADRGVSPGFFGVERVETGPEAAVARLRAGEVDAMLLHAAAWQRICRQYSAKNPKPCADLKVLAKIRPQAAKAVVVRRDMNDELRYRLIGIHLPMHLENPAAFAWASGWLPAAAEFVPAEADALLASR